MLWWFSPIEGWDAVPFHDAVGINFENEVQLLKIKVQVSSIWVKGCIHDNPSLEEGESHIILSYYLHFLIANHRMWIPDYKTGV